METKYCPSCQCILSKKEFYKDRKRPDGVQWRCKYCQLGYYQDPRHKKRNLMNARKRREKLREKKTEKTRNAMSTNRDFVEFYNNPELVAFILKTAKNQKNALKDGDYREDLIQEAWIRVAKVLPGSDLETLKTEVKRAIWAAAKKHWRKRGSGFEITLESFNEEDWEYNA